MAGLGFMCGPGLGSGLFKVTALLYQYYNVIVLLFITTVMYFSVFNHIYVRICFGKGSLSVVLNGRLSKCESESFTVISHEHETNTNTKL